MPLEFRETSQTHRSLIAFAIVACVLQVALAPQISILGGRFNFMIVLAGTIALRGNPSQAAYVGFFSGLFYDLTATVPVGLMTLLLTVGSFLLASVAGTVSGGFSSASMRLMVIFAAAICVLNAIALLVLGSEGSLLASLGHALTSTALSALAAVPALAVTGGSSGSGMSFSGGRGRSATRLSPMPRGKHAKKRTRSLR